MVRPLTWAEVRARRVLGRSQIMGDGRKLEDGVPFGRVALRGPVRPEVRIPERKRKRGDGEEVEVEGKRVRFDEDGEDEDEEDEEEDGDFELEDEQGLLEEGESSDSESDSSSDSDSDDDSESSSEDDDSDSDSGSDSDSDSSDSSSSDGSPERAPISMVKHEPGSRSARQQQHDQSQQNSGQSESKASKTQQRNHRRREGKQLKHAKEQGIFSEKATLADLREWQQTGAVPHSARPPAEQQMSNWIITEATSAPEETPSYEMDEATTDELEEAKKRLLDELNPADDALEGEDTAAPAQGPVRPQRMSAASRMVYGSLGLRAPKTAEQRKALQEQLSRRDTRAPSHEATKNVEASAKDEAAPMSFEEAESLLDISAVECCVPNITLSRPPFPFQKVWDPVQSEHFAQQKRQKRKRSSRNYGYDGQYEEEIEDGQHEEDAEPYTEAEEQEVPEVPDDITTLPVLTSNDARAGDVIAYTELTCSFETNFEPAMATRVATLIGPAEEDGEWHVTRMGARRAVDEDEQPILHGLEMPDFEEEEVVDFEREGGVRLVQRNE